MTLGEDRVRASFNPSGNNIVDEIKARTAGLIDLCHELREDVREHDEGCEVMRCLSLAMTAYEDAAMWAVKAATAKL